ncbi:hypothetical protein SBADM41S_01567 [Streptomyces badius]
MRPETFVGALFIALLSVLLGEIDWLLTALVAAVADAPDEVLPDAGFEPGKGVTSTSAGGASLNTPLTTICGPSGSRRAVLRRGGSRTYRR